jgi:uncharacterized GH25 family protein/N-acetylneuraminic acid mutarotase
MLRSLTSIALLLITTSAASAHFVFVVPDKDGHSAQVILSEDLRPDDEVPIAIIGSTKLTSTDNGGHDSALSLKKADHAYTVDFAAQPRVIHGVSELGVVKRGEAKPGVITYYPKTILGDPFDSKTRLGKSAPIELVPVGQAGKMKLLFLFDGKPVPDAEVDVISPDGTGRKVTTDKEGDTPAFEAAGRYGAWARHVDATAGELNGKHYDEIRQYATLVIDVPGLSAAVATPPTTRPVLYAPMPQAASSFGAVACDGWLYIYGGHTAETHAYSTDSVSGQFHRLNLTDHRTWETLPGGPPLQGMNLATWHGKIYRIGGMQPRNKAGEEADVRSVAGCACFDPTTKKWNEFPALPDPRSSHDVAVVGDKLIVVGGWDLTGDPDDAKWLDTALILDLSAEKPQWNSVKEPFRRRALIATSYNNKVYVIGGFETELEPSKKVDIYDPASDTWTSGPELPGPNQNGFGPAACTLDGKLYISVADGTLYRLNQAGTGWDKVASTTPRIVHRLAPNGSELLVIGGAAKKKQLNLIEAVAVSSAVVVPTPHTTSVPHPPAALPGN